MFVAANNIVASNCVGKNVAIVESSDPGPLAPPSATELKNIGPMKHCVSKLPTTTPTTTPTVADDGGSSFGDSSLGGNTSINNSNALGGSDSSSGSNAGSSDANGSSDGGASGDVHVKTSRRALTSRSELLVASNLPLGLPEAPHGLDRVATFLLGVGLFFLLRKPVANVIKRVVG